MRADDNEEKWDKLLKIKTSGRDDTQADQYAILMSRHLILFLSGWQIQDIFGKETRYLIMDVEKEEWIISCPIKQDVIR